MTRIGIIGGSGLGEALRDGMSPSQHREVNVETPFGDPSDALLLGEWNGVSIALLRRHGRDHRFMPSAVPSRANIWALRAVGCTHVLASGAVGSLQASISPGDLVVVDQMIDRTVGRPRTFFEQAAVHVEFADPCCGVMRRWLLEAAAGLDHVRTHHQGTYVCIEGPSFSTRAEAMMHRAWGADVVGMTALPEARLAREACMGYAMIALPTDEDCWRPRPPGAPEGLTLLKEIIGNLNRAVAASLDLIRAALSNVELLHAHPCAAHGALDQAIWTPEVALSDADRALAEVLRRP